MSPNSYDIDCKIMRCTLGSIAVTGPCSNWLIHNPISQADSAVSRPHPPYINHMFRHMQFPKQLTGTLSPARCSILLPSCESPE